MTIRTRWEALTWKGLLALPDSQNPQKATTATRR